jgi:taurine dioxygenase
VATSARTTTSQTFEIRPFDNLGAEIIGLDLSRELNADDFARVHRAHLDHQVVVFREQRITPEQQIAFSRRFGELQIHVLKQFHLAGHPEILIVSNIVENGQPIGLGDAGKFWHSDLSYKELPSLGSMLYAQELPSEGGDTLFADQYRAWETLPLALKKAVEGRQAGHSYTSTYAKPKFEGNWRPTLTAEQLAEVKAVVHPIVRTHPETGRQALFVSEGFTTHIVGLPEDESRQLLAELFAHSVKPEFIYRQQWRDGDMVFWDNRCLQHLAVGCPSHLRRRLHRTTIQGDAPF